MKKKGFTLIELLVVISIISFLSSIVLASLNTTRDKGRIAGARQFMATLEHSYVSVVKYSFNNSSNLGQDSSSFKNGTVTGVTWNSDTYLSSGGSGYFSSGNVLKYTISADPVSYIPSISDFQFNGKSFVLSVWVKPDAAFYTSSKSSRIIYTGHWGSTPGYTIALSTDGSQMEIQTGFMGAGNNGIYFGAYESGLLDNKWHHIAVVFDFTNKKATLYFDGKQESNLIDHRLGCQTTTVTNGSLNFASCGITYLGEIDKTGDGLDIGNCSGQCSGQPYQGYIDDAQILLEP